LNFIVSEEASHRVLMVVTDASLPCHYDLFQLARFDAIQKPVKRRVHIMCDETVCRIGDSGRAIVEWCVGPEIYSFSSEFQDIFDQSKDYQFVRLRVCRTADEDGNFGFCEERI
jgi:hypothetical protein